MTLNLDLMTDVLKSLRGQGVEVLAVDDGLQAFNLIHGCGPRSCSTPRCRAWRAAGVPPNQAEPDLAEMPVVMVTANVQESQRRIALDAGVDEYIIKPFDICVAQRVMDVLGINSV